MKKNGLTKKLAINKRTVWRLGMEELGWVRGGAIIGTGGQNLSGKPNVKNLPTDTYVPPAHTTDAGALDETKDPQKCG